MWIYVGKKKLYDNIIFSKETLFNIYKFYKDEWYIKFIDEKTYAARFSNS